jgi:hypothetical protein
MAARLSPLSAGCRTTDSGRHGADRRRLRPAQLLEIADRHSSSFRVSRAWRSTPRLGPPFFGSLIGLVSVLLAGCGETSLSLSFVSEELRAEGGLCLVVSVVENRRDRACSIAASWRGFDRAGREVGTASAEDLVPANARTTVEATFRSAGGAFVGCPEIDRFARASSDSECP